MPNLQGRLFASGECNNQPMNFAALNLNIKMNKNTMKSENFVAQIK
jgi:hypothetical protein